ncbi:hypothetical protein JN11_00637 [Mucilaginibacter frigoritolerans]|jgi:hypothetical protein|uniref:Nuclear transport factor 2 family protein n=1 Tax=Mucilaginibacter frigoritolerans TaxID=652788 RepID=A0A562UGG6_9SPHI|nr:hypothetical protein [Mucilaginibacter frigoritolerans]TWJ04914.1 hypothetical protein JN11_00637 [Mucilaginibacter frigoritolerans]
MMNPRAIDYVTEEFYESLSFQDGEVPDLDSVKILFYGDGLLINNSFSKPFVFTAQSFTQTLESQIAEGTLKQFMQRELYAKTEIFGKVAQRISVYEYNFSDYQTDNLPRGINYIQFIQTDDSWLITSMAWADENENYQIPEEYL